MSRNIRNGAMIAALLSGTLLSGCVTAPDMAARSNPCAQGAAHSEQQISTSEGELAYDVCAGALVVRAPDGQAEADLFYTAYFVKDDEPDRPLSFVWNGGPGADSRLLHFEAMGPRIVSDGTLVDNPTTPLIASDLVFLDPAGTGFSRARSEQDAAALYSTMGDIAATSSFIQRFREVYARSNSPLFLFGESFGTWRAAGTAEALADEGVPISGMGLISGGIPLGDEGDRALTRALSLPNRTATALALGRLAPDLQAKGEAVIAEAEAWARRVWYPALADPGSLTAAQKETIAQALARWHAMPPSLIDRETLWVSPRDFRKGLVEGAMLGVFDMRRIGSDPREDSGDAVVSYYRTALGYRDGLYAGVEAEAPDVGGNWQYDQAPITEESLARAMAGEGPPSPSQPWTRRVMRKLPHLRTFVAAGLYDSLNSCAANEATVASLSEDIADRIALHCYAGGHMMYDTPAIRRQFDEDVITFLRNSKDRR